MSQKLQVSTILDFPEADTSALMETLQTFYSLAVEGSTSHPEKRHELLDKLVSAAHQIGRLEGEVAILQEQLTAAKANR